MMACNTSADVQAEDLANENDDLKAALERQKVSDMG